MTDRDRQPDKRQTGRKGDRHRRRANDIHTQTARRERETHTQEKERERKREREEKRREENEGEGERGQTARQHTDRQQDSTTRHPGPSFVP
jgi:hypothetical protein